MQWKPGVLIAGLPGILIYRFWLREIYKGLKYFGDKCWKNVKWSVGACGVLGDTVRPVTSKHEKLPLFVDMGCALWQWQAGPASGCFWRTCSQIKPL